MYFIEKQAIQRQYLQQIEDALNELETLFLTGPGIAQAIRVIEETYGDTVSVVTKAKNLLKFGSRTTVGTGWEILTTAVGSETAETYATGNDIDTVVSGDAGDAGKTLKLEYHTESSGVTTFGVQDVTLDGADGTTPVSLTTPAFRTSRAYNTSSSDLVGPIYFYQDNTGRDDDKTHLVIPAGEQQTQKASTTISGTDYWIITSISASVLSKTTKYAEFRLVAKPVTQSYFLPISQTVSVTDTTGTVELLNEPYVIVPSDYDVALQVKTNTSAVDVAGGFSGYLAEVV